MQRQHGLLAYTIVLDFLQLIPLPILLLSRKLKVGRPIKTRIC